MKTPLGATRAASLAGAARATIITNNVSNNGANNVANKVTNGVASANFATIANAGPGASAGANIGTSACASTTAGGTNDTVASTRRITRHYRAAAVECRNEVNSKIHLLRLALLTSASLGYIFDVR
jgi:hypothetical protein